MKLNVLTTERCNFSCKHCIFDCPNDFSIPIELLKKTIKNLNHYNLKHLAFSGGECVLHPDFPKFVDEAVKNKLTYSIVSNGFFYNKYLPIIQQTKKYLSSITFSLDGMKKTHDYIRKKGSFDKVVEAIYFYKLLNIKVYVNFILNKKNLDEIESVFELCKKLGVEKIFIGAILPTPKNKKLWLSIKERKQKHNEIKKLSEKHEIYVQNTLSLYKPDFFDFCPNLINNSLTLTPKNEFTFCCNIPGSYSKIGNENDNMSDIYKKKNKITEDMLSQRLDYIKKGEIRDEDHTCLFCYKYFKVPPFD